MLFYQTLQKAKYGSAKTNMQLAQLALKDKDMSHLEQLVARNMSPLADGRAYARHGSKVSLVWGHGTQQPRQTT